MSRLGPDSSFPLTTRALAVAVRRLQTRLETRALAEQAGAVLDRALAQDAARHRARVDCLAAEAEVRYLRRELGAGIMAASRAALALVGGRRADPVYRALFPEAPSVVVRRLAADEEGRTVHLVADRLASSPALAHYGNDLMGLQFTLYEVQALRRSLYEVEAAVKRQHEQALAAARQAFNGLRAQLEAVLPGRELLVRSLAG